MGGACVKDTIVISAAMPAAAVVGAGAMLGVTIAGMLKVGRQLVGTDSGKGSLNDPNMRTRIMLETQKNDFHQKQQRDSHQRNVRESSVEEGAISLTSSSSMAKSFSQANTSSMTPGPAQGEARCSVATTGASRNQSGKHSKGNPRPLEVLPQITFGSPELPLQVPPPVTLARAGSYGKPDEDHYKSDFGFASVGTSLDFLGKPRILVPRTGSGTKSGRYESPMR